VLLKASSILLIFCVMVGVSPLAAQSLAARLEDTQLRISAPRVHFLTGRPLERLRNGATVHYTFQLVLSNQRNGAALARVDQRFALSYDLWEEKFAATKLASPSRSVSHLSAAAAEAWCLDNLTLPIAGLAESTPFWIRLEFRSEELKESPDPDGEGFTLTGLIDIFSRRVRDDELRGVHIGGPLRLENLRKR
jgi:hypothetical protein